MAETCGNTNLIIQNSHLSLEKMQYNASVILHMLVLVSHIYHKLPNRN